MVAQELDHVDDEIAECTDNCVDVAQVCEWCADECADQGEEMAECLRLCRDVADLATLHTRSMVRESDYNTALAEVCADAYGECAEECEQHDHKHCQVCADVLREGEGTVSHMAS